MKLEFSYSAFNMKEGGLYDTFKIMVKKKCTSTDIWNGSLGLLFFSNFAFKEEKIHWVMGRCKAAQGSGSVRGL